MKIETKEIYKCDFCNRWYQRKNAAVKHEDLCIKNPYNCQPCFNCIHLSKKEAYVECDYTYGNDGTKVVEALYCKKKEIYLHTPRNSKKDNAFTIVGADNLPMPRECKYFDNGCFELGKF